MSSLVCYLFDHAVSASLRFSSSHSTQKWDSTSHARADVELFTSAKPGKEVNKVKRSTNQSRQLQNCRDCCRSLSP
ncbi:hypothetical protein AV530_005279 [Patagioenas fasciata monilis]|uniref:Uncharacterized protein n=1 Tax=Patagioenas fasciata monilis TaxID=372326 RepID=A0A1V4JL48_PATFA|nr:hypothetical protein AV530_005279 [Patagioenas fasciata monilis]